MFIVQRNRKPQSIPFQLGLPSDRSKSVGRDTAANLRIGVDLADQSRQIIIQSCHPCQSQIDPSDSRLYTEKKAIRDRLFIEEPHPRSPSIVLTHIEGVSMARLSPASIARRLFLFSLVTSAICGGVAADAFAQNDVETDQVTTADGWKIPFHYYPSREGKDAAVVLLLHGEGKNRLVWKANGFAEALQKTGFAVIAMDYRKHGEAKAGLGSATGGKMTRRDWQAVASAGWAAGDIESVKKFIFDQHQEGKLNMSKMAIVACEEAAPVAAAWAASDWAKAPYNDAPTAIAKTRKGQDVRALLLVSPAESVPGVPGQAAVRLLKDAASAFYPVAGEELMPSIVFLYGNDAKDKRTAEELYDTVHVKPIEDRVFKAAFPTPARGSMMLRIAPIQTQMVKFLKDSVQNADVEWQDRRSRLQR